MLITKSTQFTMNSMAIVRGYQLAHFFFTQIHLTFAEALERVIALGGGARMLNPYETKRRRAHFDQTMTDMDSNPVVEVYKDYFIKILGDNPSLL